MKLQPQRSVLRKIAARRHKEVRSDARITWATVLTKSMSEPERCGSVTSLFGQRILTPREMEVLYLVAEGETDQRIADRLYLSRRTVNCHVSNILSKLDVPSRRAAVITAARVGLL